MAEQDDGLLDRLASAQQAAEFDDALTELAADAVDVVDREALDNLAAAQHAAEADAALAELAAESVEGEDLARAEAVVSGTILSEAKQLQEKRAEVIARRSPLSAAASEAQV